MAHDHPGNDKRYVRRDEQGPFDELVDVGRSFSLEREREAKHDAKSGHGDRGAGRPERAPSLD